MGDFNLDFFSQIVGAVFYLEINNNNNKRLSFRFFSQGLYVRINVFSLDLWELNCVSGCLGEVEIKTNA